MKTVLRFSRRLIPALALLFAVALPPAAAQQPASILIWPVDPVINGSGQAAPLWIENPGTKPTTLQVQIYAWAQQDGRDVYASQNEILGTPPILTMQPGERQLVRLTRIGPASTVLEKAFRIIVDEIPVAETDSGQGVAVSFRMRYSLPLFTYAPTADREPTKAKRKPSLTWRVTTNADGRFLEMHNSGAGHARLTDVVFDRASNERILAKGLLGYVLPGSTMLWPLDPDVDATAPLTAAINGSQHVLIKRHQE